MVSKQFLLGMKCLQYHLQTLTLEISDQDIYQLCQIFIFRIQCVSFLTDGGGGWLSGDGRHLGECTPKDQLKRYLEWEDQRDGDKRHNGVKTESSVSGRSTQMHPQVLQQLLTLVLRHKDTLQCLRGNPAGADAGQQRLEEQQGEARTSSTLPSLHNDQPATHQTSEDHGSTNRKRPEEECNQVQPDGSEWQMPIPQLAHGAKTADCLQIPSTDDGRNNGDVEQHQVKHGGFKSHSEIPQPEEDGWRSNQGSPVPFLWMVSKRINLELWHSLQQLSHHSCLQLIQASLRPGTLQRSALARQLQPKKCSR